MWFIYNPSSPRQSKEDGKAVKMRPRTTDNTTNNEGGFSRQNGQFWFDDGMVCSHPNGRLFKQWRHPDCLVPNEPDLMDGE